MKHLTPIRLFVFLFGCLCLINPAQAAYEFAGLQWSPTLSVDETYDSNVTFAPSDEHSDFITAFAPGFEAVAEGKTETINLAGHLHEKIFAEESDFNNFSQDLSGVYKKEFSEYNRVAFTESLLHADQPSSFDDEFGRQSGRYDFLKNLFTASFSHDFSSQLTGTAKYGNDYYNPDRDDLANSVANLIGIQTDYALSSQTIPYLLYEYAQRDYSPGGTISRNSIGGGLKYYLTEQVYVNSRLMADFIEPIGRDEITKPNFLIGLVDEADPKTTYGAYFSSHYEDSSYDQNLLNSWRFSVSWGKELMERLKMYLMAFTGGGKFEPDGAKERLNGIGATLDYELTHNQVVSLGFRVWDKNSSDDTRDYDKNTVSLNWKIKF